MKNIVSLNVYHFLVLHFLEYVATFDELLPLVSGELNLGLLL